MSIAQPIIDYLHQLENKGETHVHLDETARNILREFYIRAHQPSQPAPAPQAAQPAPQAQTAQATAAAQAQTSQASAPAQPATPAAPAVSTVTITGDNKAAKLQSLYQQASNWTPGRSLGSLREKLIGYSGSPDADIMFISPAPQYHDERQGHPLSGPGGQKLDGILKAMGLTREQVYITNLVKFRPASPNQQTKTRKPNAQEVQAFLPLLQSEISIVQPKIILSLGDIVTHSLTGREGDIESLRTSYSELNGSTVIPTFHPSYLLFYEDNATKRKLWEDMLTVMEKLSMPISDKQRGYFLPKA